ncbi:hypothetical protein H0A66_15945 [Alcaligenaceae bacterium]|nr:hypothetical protein [Alcaligenaceae bacterium]
MVRAIRGSDEERAKNELQKNIESIRGKLPDVLVERIEIPGIPVETPDLAAVTALIPAAEVAALDSDPRATTSVPGAAQPPRSDKVEARKNLHEIGLTYHSQAQFIDAIKRNDELAVELFISAGAVNPDAAGKDGKTPLQLSKSEKITMLLEGKQPVTALTPSPSAERPGLQAASATTASVDFTKIPADHLADFDNEIAKLNLSNEQKLIMRTRFAQQYLQTKRLADAIN